MKAKILCIDGGGIKGIIPARILEYIEKHVRNKKGDGYHIHESFNLLSGTSTGGIIVIGLLCPGPDGQAKFSVSDLLDLYVKKGNLIFQTSAWDKIKNVFGILHEKYSPKNIETLFKQYFDDIKLSQLLKNCLIPSYNIYDRCATFYNTDDTKDGDGYQDFYIRDIARATSAAPTYFPPAHIKPMTGETYYTQIDGGVFANNPAMSALVEYAKQNGTSSVFDLNLKDITLISAGTGVHTATKKRYTYDETKNWGQVSWISPLIDIMMSASSETIDFQLRKLYECTGNKDNYIRIQPDLRRASPEMDDASDKNINALLQDADEYISQNQEFLNKIVDIILG
jgi:patatin-like phospholipase/acyl hydrolase